MEWLLIGGIVIGIAAALIVAHKAPTFWQKAVDESAEVANKVGDEVREVKAEVKKRRTRAMKK